VVPHVVRTPGANFKILPVRATCKVHATDFTKEEAIELTKKRMKEAILRELMEKVDDAVLLDAEYSHLEQCHIIMAEIYVLQKET